MIKLFKTCLAAIAIVIFIMLLPVLFLVSACALVFVIAYALVAEWDSIKKENNPD